MAKTWIKSLAGGMKRKGIDSGHVGKEKVARAGNRLDVWNKRSRWIKTELKVLASVSDKEGGTSHSAKKLES